jgi:hypothetical protein
VRPDVVWGTSCIFNSDGVFANDGLRLLGLDHYTMEESRTFLGTQVKAEVLGRIIEYLHHGDKLNSIRLIRENSDLHLYAARQVVDAIAAEENIVSPHIPEYDLVRDFHYILTTGRPLEGEGRDQVHDWVKDRCDFYVRQGLVSKNNRRYSLTH